MIDIHNHVLPGFDDGPKTPDESLDLLRIAEETGISVMFATPHVTNSHELKASPRIIEELARLQCQVDDAGIRVRLVPGAEIVPTADLLRALDDGLPLTLAGMNRHVLLEMPTMSMPIGIGQFVFDLQSRGFTPVFSHPERIQPVQDDPQVLEEFVERGVLLQVTASSLLKHAEDEVARTARTFIRLRWAHFVASDAHSPRRRRPRLAEAAKALEAALGKDEILDLVQNNGQRVLNGEEVPTNPAAYTPERRPSFFARVFGKRR